jgi:hypothetical protein
MSSTRIADLPDTINISKSRGESSSAIGTTAYTPLNIHENPYGTSPQPENLPISQSTHQNNQQNAVRAENTHTGFSRTIQTNDEIPNWNNIGNDNFQSMPNHQQQQPEYRLPSRDMPRGDTAEYMHDEQTRVNHIPKKKLTSDYIRDFEENEETFIKKHEQEKAHRTNNAELATRVQIPILLMFLFYIFHLSGFHAIGYKFFKGLGIYDIDGNMNTMGTIFKSIIFGIVYFLMNECVIWINKW